MSEIIQEITVRLQREIVGSEPRVVVVATGVPHPLAGIDLLAAAIHECIALHERMVQEALAKQERGVIAPIRTSMPRQ